MDERDPTGQRWPHTFHGCSLTDYVLENVNLPFEGYCCQPTDDERDDKENKKIPNSLSEQLNFHVGLLAIGCIVVGKSTLATRFTRYSEERAYVIPWFGYPQSNAPYNYSNCDECQTNYTHHA
jgi:hypothetical protein